MEMPEKKPRGRLKKLFTRKNARPKTLLEEHHVKLHEALELANPMFLGIDRKMTDTQRIQHMKPLITKISEVKGQIESINAREKHLEYFKVSKLEKAKKEQAKKDLKKLNDHLKESIDNYVAGSYGSQNYYLNEAIKIMEKYL
jgi:hypothetical protein